VVFSPGIHHGSEFATIEVIFSQLPKSSGVVSGGTPGTPTV
jgi:hypothetical protein